MSAEMNGVTPILQAKGLMKRYGTVVAMSGADFELMPGEICAVIGDNVTIGAMSFVNKDIASGSTFYNAR